MSEPARRKATYDDLHGLPENTVGEIINGELIVTPRPALKHAHAITQLGVEIGPPYSRGRGGPGGWVFLIEPEVKFEDDMVVPDLAGWKREKFLPKKDQNWMSVVPDWVCEVLSASTVRTDKVRKMPLYARYGVGHVWLIDPTAMTLDAFELESGKWSLLASFLEQDRVRIEPFPDIEIDLGSLWMEEQ